MVGVSTNVSRPSYLAFKYPMPPGASHAGLMGFAATHQTFAFGHRARRALPTPRFGAGCALTSIMAMAGDIGLRIHGLAPSGYPFRGGAPRSNDPPWSLRSYAGALLHRRPLGAARRRRIGFEDSIPL